MENAWLFLAGHWLVALVLDYVCTSSMLLGSWRILEVPQDMPREFPVDHHAKQAVVVYSLHLVLDIVLLIHDSTPVECRSLAMDSTV